MSSLKRSWKSFEPHKERPNYLHMLIGLSIATFMFFVYSLTRFIPDVPSLVSIAVFNFLFVFLIYPLKGPLQRKIFLLLLGNVVGLAWNSIRSLFATVLTQYLAADSIKVVYVIIWPIVDFLWIVCIWSLGLSLLVSAKRRKEEGENIH